MSQAITTLQDGFNVSERPGTSLIGGRAKIKFLDGVYKLDKVQVLPPETALVAIDVTTCWVKWQGGLPVEHRVTQPGQVHPHRDDLPDLDEAAWEPGLNNAPADPWRDTRYLRLIHPLTGAEYTFITDSAGGRIAIGQLKDQIRKIRFAQPNAVPLVKLGSAPFKTRFGIKERPAFEVLEWRNKGSGQARQQQIEQQTKDEDTFGLPPRTNKQAHPFDDDIPF